MRIVVYISILISLATSCTYIDEARYKDAIIEGNQLADSSQHELALQQFDKAISINDSLTAAYFNVGNSKMKLNRYTSALENYAFVEAKQSDSTILSDIYYQKGNAYLNWYFYDDATINSNLKKADSIDQNKGNDIKQRIRANLVKDSLLKENDSIAKRQKISLESAKKEYISSINYHYQNDSAVYNYIYTLKLIQQEENAGKDNKKDEKKEPTEFALKAKQKALELVKQHKFQEAYQTLSEAAQKDPTVNNFSELIQKLNTINEIIEKHGQ